MLNDTEEYFYIRNAQSDIIGIINSIGKQVVSYTYDTWGKLISITGDKALGEKNPYRYRGYRYDTETGYYYLQSRYYNPEWGRFLNGDAIGGSIGELLSHNTFAYCNNNPVISKDPNGFRPMYTQGEETAAMRDASYKVMNQYYGTKYHNPKPKSTAVKDAIKGGIIGALEGSFGDGLKEIPDYIEYCVNRQAWRHGGTLIPVKGASFLRAIGRVEKSLGIVGVGMGAVGAIKSFNKGEIAGGFIDLGATAAGVGVGALMGTATTLLITAGAPVIATGALVTLAGMGISALINIGAEAWKDEIYGR